MSIQITSFQTALPLKLQLHQGIGFAVCFIAMAGVYWGNAWDAKELPFMSTRLRMDNGTTYPIDEVFVGGVLDTDALAEFGLPRLTGTFAFALFMANAAVCSHLHACLLLTNAKCLLDWRLDFPRHPLLGKGHHQRIQERED